MNSEIQKPSVFFSFFQEFHIISFELFFFFHFNDIFGKEHFKSKREMDGNDVFPCHSDVNSLMCLIHNDVCEKE